MILERFQMIIPPQDLKRIKVRESKNVIRICVDVHGLTCLQTRSLVNNIINLPRTSFQLMVIHGFNHGTAIKNMLADNFENDHILSRAVDQHNPGITYMQIAA